jgi:hypothetical protein
MGPPQQTYVVCLRDLGSAIARSVVDDDHLDRVVRLGEHAPERLGDKRLLVEGRHHD